MRIVNKLVQVRNDTFGDNESCHSDLLPIKEFAQSNFKFQKFKDKRKKSYESIQSFKFNNFQKFGPQEISYREDNIMNISSPVSPIEIMKFKKSPKNDMLNREGSPIGFFESQSSAQYQTLKSSKINEDGKASFHEIEKN